MSALSRGASRSLYRFFSNVQYTRDNGAKVHSLQTDAACMLSPISRHCDVWASTTPHSLLLRRGQSAQLPWLVATGRTEE